MSDDSEDSWYRYFSPLNFFGSMSALLFAVLLYVQIFNSPTGSQIAPNDVPRTRRVVTNVREDDLQSWIKQDPEHEHFSRQTGEGPPDGPKERAERRLLTSEWQALSPDVRRGLKSIDFDTSVPVVSTPEFRLPSIDGDTVSLRDVRGKWVLLNFWGSWCGPCRREMPGLESLADELPAGQFKLLAINVEESPGKVDKFLDSESLSLPVLLDRDGVIAQRYHVRALPVSWLVAPGGNLVGRFLGVRHWTSPPVRSVLKELVSSRQPGAK